jgi:uncharacterized protein (DUF433 family)
MLVSSYRYIGFGIYTVPEASRLTGMPAPRIRRWLLGYRYRVSGELRWSEPIVRPLFDPLGGEVAISFLDLMELRFVNAFLKNGISWKVLREVYAKATEVVGHSRPFSTRRFKTDGQTILTEIGRPSGRATVDLKGGQMGFWSIIAPFYKKLEIDKDEVSRWRPSPRIVIDPQLNFGQPTLAKEGVPTHVLHQAYLVEKSFVRVASWYRLSPQGVRAAVEFEERIAA